MSLAKKHSKIPRAMFYVEFLDGVGHARVAAKLAKSLEKQGVEIK